jgi:hypothetical protein
MALINVSLTDRQKSYVLKNYNRMSTYEMARSLGLAQTKVFENMQLMGLERTLHKSRQASGKFIKSAKFFNVNEVGAGGTWLV